MPLGVKYCGQPCTHYPPNYQSQSPQQYYQQSQYPPQQYYEQQQPQNKSRKKKEMNPFFKIFWGCAGAVGFFIVLIVIIMFLVSGRSKDKSNDITVVTSTAQYERAPQIEQPVQSNTQSAPNVYRLGDAAMLADKIVTMNEVSTAGGILKATFTIENTSNESTTASTLLEWNAKNSDGEKLSQEIFDCGGSSLGGTILSHDKLKGSICFTITGNPPFKLYYSPELFSSKTHVWQVE